MKHLRGKLYKSNTMDKINTIHVLGIISIVELLATQDMWYSVRLWTCYGIYKIICYLIGE